MRSPSSAPQLTGDTKSRPDVEIRRPNDKQRAWIASRCTQIWGAEVVVSRGHLHKPAELPAFIAIEGAAPAGIITWKENGNNWEIVTVDAFERHQGVGTVLMAALEEHARSAGCRRLWLVTTNDNLDAVRFYQRRGYTLVELHPNALTHSRQLKPSIPLIGDYGIPLRDELVFEKALLGTP